MDNKIILCLCMVLNCVNLGTQDEEKSVSAFSDYLQKRERYDLKPENKWKKFEILYSLKETWEVINSPQFAGESVVKKIRTMWDSKTPPKIIQKKPRKKRKNATTTTTAIPGEVVTTTQLYETTTRARLPGRQNPFVLIEGTHTQSRRNLTRGLMKHTTFVYIRNFRQTPFKYRDKLNSGNVLRLKRAFITLQMYITGRDIERVLEDRPVIMSGYWMRQAAECIARQYTDISKLPPVGSDCYKWPDDLVKPDLIYFLHTPRVSHNEESGKRIDRIVEIYQRMDPPVIVLDESYAKLTDKKVAGLRNSMLEKLSQKYPHAKELVKYKVSSGKKRVKGSRKNKTSQIHKKHKVSANITLEEDLLMKNVSINE